MSLPGIALELIREVTGRISSPPGHGPRRAISFGYPDILASEDQIFDLFGNEVSKELRFRPDSQAILKWHSATGLTDRIVESRHFFSLLGYDLTIADIAPIRGDEVILDLNEPLDAALLAEPFDLVIDGGTAEHCFNIGQALKNMADLVRVGGCVFHINPASMFNHGFYNLNPTLYADFYDENRFRITFLKAVTDIMFNPTLIEVPPYQRFATLPSGAILMCVAQRAQQQAIRWPMQAKYRKNPSQTR